MNQEHRQNNSSPVDFDGLAKSIRETVKTDLATATRKMLDSAQNKLFDLSNAASSNEDQNRFFELMNQVRTLKQEIAVEFNMRLAEALVPEPEKPDNQTESFSDDTELSLVGQEEIEGMVLVKSIGGRAAGKFQEPLSHLQKRFEALSDKTVHIFNADTITPIGVCQLFNDALQNNFEQPAKKTLFEIYDKEVINQLDELYSKLNTAMIDAGILPQIKVTMGKPVQHAQRHTPAASTDDSESGQEYTDDGQHSTGSGASGPASYGGAGKTSATTGGHAGPSGNYAGQSQSMGSGGSPGTMPDSSPTTQGNVMGNAMTATPGSFTATHASTPTGQNLDSTGQTEPSGSATASNVYTHHTAGMPASQVGQTLSNYFGTPFTPETSHRKAAENPDYFPASTTQYLGHQEIIRALSNLQINTEFLNSTNSTFDGEAIKKAVLNEIAKVSGGAVTKSINKIAEKTIDFIEMVFDAIIEDSNISDTIKTLLLRLQIPIIKASMSDQEFFIYDTHPARILVDRIAEVGVGVIDHTDIIYVKIDDIVNGILTDYELSEDTFVKALEKLENFVKEQEEVRRTKEEEKQLELLRKQARSTVLRSLRASTTGKVLPDDVHALILKRWPTLMFNHYLNHGKDNSVWINMVLTLRQIIEFVQPIKMPEQLARISQRKDALFEITESYLRESIKSKRDIREVMDAFINTVQSNIEDANFNNDELIEAEQNLQPDTTEQNVIEDEKTSLPEIPPNIMPGMWFRIYMGEDKVPRRCKLSVILIEDANLMFVDHKGELVAEKSFDEFNQEVEQGLTEVIMDRSTFDHAFKSALNRIH